MNLLFIGNLPDKAATIHPTYLTYSHVNPVLGAMRRHLSDAEMNEIVQGYRRSEFSETALVEDYKRGEVPKHPLLKDEHYYKALEQTSKRFAPPQKTRPVAFPDLRYYPWTISTSAEEPYVSADYWRKFVTAKWKAGEIPNNRLTFHNLYNTIFVHNREKVHRIKDGIYVDRQGHDLRYHNKAHARAHLVKSDDPDKIRMVFGIPKLLLMVECMFLWPIINHLIDDMNGPMLWGFETLRGGWYSMHNWMATQEPRSGTYIALDWKQFDKRTQFELIDDIHGVLRSFLDFEHGYIPTIEHPETYTNPERLERLWNWMREAIKHTPDVLPNGDTYIRQHAGIASGYFQTQLLDSMCNMQMLLTVLSKMGINLDTIKVKVQGDDSIIAIAEVIPPQQFDKFLLDVAEVAQEYYGAILNTKKSKISSTLNGLPLLGFTNKSGIPTKPKTELLANLLYPERKSDEPKLMARTVGIAYANCGNHLDVYRICKDVFQYLQNKGFSPNSSGLPRFITILNEWFEPELDDEGKLVFPTYYSTFARLTDTPTRTPNQKDKLWPEGHFISRF